MVQLWVVAEELLIPKVQNVVIDQLEEANQCRPTVDAVDYVYASTAVDSHLRKLLAHHFAWSGADYNGAERMTPRPQEFLFDLIELYRQAAPEINS